MISQSFYARDAELVGKEILGNVLVRISGDKILSGKIVETEAYYGAGDPASRARRSKKLYMWWKNTEPSTVFVYMVHGNWLFNIVTGKVNNEPSGILIRALEPLEGIKVMKKNRGIKEEEKLTSGPGKLTQALDITDRHIELKVANERSKIIVVSGEGKIIEIACTHRIGVIRDLPQPLRFYIKGNRYVSR